jgi:hypothetical protein
MTNSSVNNSPASMPKYELTTKGKDVLDDMSLVDLPLQTQCSFYNNSSDDDEEVVIQPTESSELQNLTSKVHRLLSFDKSDDAQSESLQACTLSLRTRLPMFLRRTEQLNEEQHNSCKRQTSLALLRATHYVDRIEEGMNIDSNESMDEQLRTVMAGLNAEALPDSVRNNLSFRLSSWVHGYDLPVGATTRLTLERKGKQRPLLVEVEPIVEFRADDKTSVNYASRAAKACTVTIQKCKHVACNIGTGAGVIGEGSMQIHVSPLGDKQSLDDNGKACSLQIKEVRV